MLRPPQSVTIRKKRATEAEWFKWFYEHVDLGLNAEDIRLGMKMRFMSKTGKNLPEQHNRGYFAGSGLMNLDEI